MSEMEDTSDVDAVGSDDEADVDAVGSDDSGAWEESLMASDGAGGTEAGLESPVSALIDGAFNNGYDLAVPDGESSLMPHDMAESNPDEDHIYDLDADISAFSLCSLLIRAIGPHFAAILK